MYLFFPNTPRISVTGGYNPERFEGHNYPISKSVTKKEALLFTQIKRQDITSTLSTTLF